MSSETAGPAFTPRHDHDRCVSRALETAAEVCRRQGARLTPQRRRVLELVWASHRPVGAYTLLEELRAEGINAAPPTVYRALDFLLEHGLIHRLESLNAFVGCTHPGKPHAGQFLVCRGCQEVAELDERRITRAVEASAADLGFSAEHHTVEISGLCDHCREHAGE